MRRLFVLSVLVGWGCSVDTIDDPGTGPGGEGPLTGYACSHREGCESELERLRERGELEPHVDDCLDIHCEDLGCFYLAQDVDRDGYRADCWSTVIRILPALPGETFQAPDCDDRNENVHPGASDAPRSFTNPIEGCGDDLDNDCSGAIDDGVLEDGTTCACTPHELDLKCDFDARGRSVHIKPANLDSNGVPYGSCTLGVRRCFPDGLWGECDDAVGPRPETCAEPLEDRDCDGRTGGEQARLGEVDVRGLLTYVCDADGDEFLPTPTTNNTRTGCIEPDEPCGGSQGVWRKTTSSPAEVDCDDNRADTNPQSPELCDGRDNDCDGEIDETSDMTPAPWSDANTVLSCETGAWAVSECPRDEDGNPIRLDCDGGSEGTLAGVISLCETDASTRANCRACGTACIFSCGLAGCAEISSLALGFAHSCAVLTDGKIACWGDNGAGQIGNGTSSSVQLLPAAVVTSDPFELVDAGQAHTCAVALAPNAETQVYCWGASIWGQAGLVQTALTAPSRVATGNDVTALRVGSEHSCVVQNNGDVACWGNRRDGRLGRGGNLLTTDSAVPLPGSVVVYDPDADPQVTTFTDAVELALGARHSCVRTEAGRVFCAGDNSKGQLGDGSSDAARTVFQPVPGLEDVTQLVSGQDFSCAVVTGEVYCWGDNQTGQTGQTGGGLTPVPTLVGGLEGPITQVAAGYAFACALSEGHVHCWGSADRGQLGQPGLSTSPSPLLLGGLEAVSHLAAGGTHACAQSGSGGPVRCWGNNLSGQLGLGKADNPIHPLPALIQPLTPH